MGRLGSALRRGERVAVVGRPGEGKSSLIQFALGPMVEGLAPLPITVGIEVADVVRDPAAFAAHLVGKEDLLDAVVVTAGRHAYRRRDGIAMVPAAMLGP